MSFNVMDEIIYDNKRFIIIDEVEVKNNRYFFLSTTEKPITGEVVEYKIEDNELYINDSIPDDVKREVLLERANRINIEENQ